MTASRAITRKTNETDVYLNLAIDGKGRSSVNTGCGFLDHMLTLFSKHSGMDLEVKAKGDVEVDYHHTVEDVGIALGKALFDSLFLEEDSMKGRRRYGNMILPMDESLILSALDLSGRAYLSFEADIPTAKVGDFDTELCEEFFAAFVRNAAITLHIKQLSGRNSHHIIEGIFKSVARAFREALSLDERFKDEIPSTKGVL
jgi:imidazoleglycerol-phosphate dehydratase